MVRRTVPIPLLPHTIRAACSFLATLQTCSPGWPPWMIILAETWQRRLRENGHNWKLHTPWKTTYSMKNQGWGRLTPEKLVEGEFPKGLCQFQTKICNFLPPFSYLTQNVMPRFRHGASKNYSVPIKHTQFTPKCTNYTLYLQIKTAKIYIVVKTKTAENHTLWCCAYLCGPLKGVSFPLILNYM